MHLQPHSDFVDGLAHGQEFLVRFLSLVSADEKVGTLLDGQVDVIRRDISLNLNQHSLVHLTDCRYLQRGTDIQLLIRSPDS